MEGNIQNIKKIYELNKDAAIFYHKFLLSENGKDGLSYFKKRELSDETIKKFALGVSPKNHDSLIKYLLKKGYEKDFIEASGLSNYGKYDKFQNRAMFPIVDEDKNVVGFGGRTLSDEKPKYINTPTTMAFNKSKTLYGYNIAKKHNRIIACEGYMDVIAMHQAGFTEAVASLGTALTEDHVKMISQNTKDVYLAYDMDEAGIKATKRALELFQEVGINGKVISLDKFKDPDEFIKAKGKEGFEKAIEDADEGIVFLLERYLIEELPSTDFFLEKAANEILKYKSQSEWEYYSNTVANAFLFDICQIKEKILKMYK